MRSAEVAKRDDAQGHSDARAWRPQKGKIHWAEKDSAARRRALREARLQSQEREHVCTMLRVWGHQRKLYNVPLSNFRVKSASQQLEARSPHGDTL